jgi:ABC-type transport system involved in multi-copper enzyme maturation permease subunit
VDKNPTPGEIVVMAGAGVALLFSFFPFHSTDVGNFSDDTSAWGSGLFPVATLIPIFAVIAGVLVALVRFANVHYPPGGFLGFSWSTLLLALTFFSAILAVAFLVNDRPVGTSLGFGFWFVLIGAVGSLVGAVIMMDETRTRA